MKQKSVLLHKAVIAFVRPFARLYVKFKYRFTTDRMPRMKEPFIMLSNHTTEDDMCFTGVASRNHMYFVCGEHLLRNPKYGKLLRTLIDPIPIPKGGASIAAVREILRRTRAGHSICMFPEGKRSFHGETIPNSTALGQLVKRSRCALVTYRIRGGYFTLPRWARNHPRKGHVEGKVVGIYSSAQLAEMTAEEITDIINRDTYENAYATQREKRWPYPGDHLAEGMEHVLFLCPCCHAMDTIVTQGDSFSCTACGMQGVYNTYGFLESEQLPFDNVLDWMRWLEPEFDRYVLEHDTETPLFTQPDVLLYRMMDGYRNEPIRTDTLRIYRDRMEFGPEGASESTYRFPFSEITSPSVLYGTILLFTYKDTYYGLSGDTFHAWKGARAWHLFSGDTYDPTKEI